MLFIPKLKYHLSRTQVRRPFYWYRHRGITPADVFVACFPRAGSTWLRFLLCAALAPGDTGFEDVYRMIPALGGQKHAPCVLPGGGRVVRTHESYRAEYKKAVYLVRDLRDTLISNYNYLCGREFFHGSLDDFVEPFLTGKLYGYGDWRAHVESWLGSPLNAEGKLLVVRYEDLRQQTEQTLGRILEFMGVEIPAERIREVVEDNSLRQMQGKEEKARGTTFRNYPGSFRFVRKGTVGEGQGELSEKSLKRIESYAGDLLAGFGYESPTQPADRKPPELKVSAPAAT